MHIGLYHYLFVAAGLFAAGLLTILTKRNALGILMGVELVLNSANVNLVAFGRYSLQEDPATGQVFALFVIVIAAAEAAVAMAIFLNFYNNFTSIDVERGRNLKG